MEIIFFFLQVVAGLSQMLNAFFFEKFSSLVWFNRWFYLRIKKPWCLAFLNKIAFFWIFTSLWLYNIVSIMICHIYSTYVHRIYRCKARQFLNFSFWPPSHIMVYFYAHEVYILNSRWFWEEIWKHSLPRDELTKKVDEIALSK